MHHKVLKLYLSTSTNHQFFEEDLEECCFRIAERCFQSDEPPVRERRFIVKGLGDIERPINIAKKVNLADFFPSVQVVIIR